MENLSLFTSSYPLVSSKPRLIPYFSGRVVTLDLKQAAFFLKTSLINISRSQCHERKKGFNIRLSCLTVVSMPEDNG